MKTKKLPHLNRVARSQDDACEKALRLMDQGDHNGALAGLDALLIKEPGHLEARLNKGVCLGALGQVEQAARHFHSVHVSAPSHLLTLKLCAQAHDRAKFFDMTLKFWVLYTNAKPDEYEAWSSMARVALRMGKHVPSVMYATQALSLEPQNPNAYNNLGSTLLALERLDDAEQAFQTTIALEPDNSTALSNLALLSFLRGNHKEAVRAYESLLPKLNLEPDALAEFMYRSGFAYLGAGHLKEGWRRLEYGFEVADALARWPQRKFMVPRWTGEPVDDKRLLVWREQGLGDELLFYGVLNELEAMCPNIMVECEPRLVSLLQRSFPRMTVRASTQDTIKDLIDPGCDFHIAAGSLMGIFRNHLDDFKKYRPYIKPNPELVMDFSERLKPYAGKKLVGICWRSGNVNATRIKHYMMLGDFSEILQNPDYVVVNLQYGDCEEEVLRVEQALGVQVVRWADVDLKDDQEAVAALMSQLDVVIAPQSAVEKMAIAVGVPVIIFGLKLWSSLGQEHYPWSSNAELISPDTGQPITTVLPRIMSSLQAIST